MLGHRLRRWPNIITPLFQHVWFLCVFSHGSLFNAVFAWLGPSVLCCGSGAVNHWGFLKAFPRVLESQHPSACIPGPRLRGRCLINRAISWHTIIGRNYFISGRYQLNYWRCHIHIWHERTCWFSLNASKFNWKWYIYHFSDIEASPVWY